MEINKANSLKFTKDTSFAGKKEDVTQKSEVEEQVSSYNDKSANAAIASAGRAMLAVNINKACDNTELPDSIKELLVRDKNDTDETFQQREALAKKLYSNKDKFSLTDEEISFIIRFGTTSNFYSNDSEDFKAVFEVADLLLNKNFSNEDICEILANMNKWHLEFTKELIESDTFPNEHIKDIFQSGYGADKDFRKKLCIESDFPYEYMDENLAASKIYNVLYANVYEDISDELRSETRRLHEKLCFDKDLNFPKEYIRDIIDRQRRFYSDNVALRRIQFTEKLCEDKNFPKDKISELLQTIQERGQETSDLDVFDFAEELIDSKKYSIDQIKYLITGCNLDNMEDARFACKNCPELIEKYSAIKKEDGNKRFDISSVFKLVRVYSKYPQSVDALVNLKTEDGRYRLNAESIINLTESYEKNPELVTKLIYTKNENNKFRFNDHDINFLANYEDNYNNLERTIGSDKIKKLSNSDIKIGTAFYEIINKSDINELSLSQKRSLLKEIMKTNIDLLYASPFIKDFYPILPSNKEEYCSLLPAIVRSLGIETKELSKDKTDKFYVDVKDLSDNLKKLSDEEFYNLKIDQDYSKDEFISDVWAKVKDLPEKERAKVYDYFGFELRNNEKTETKFSIIGYPVNLNNGEKLAKINDTKTKAVIENLRNDVIRFSENNRIKCDNPELEDILNNIIDVLPELRPQIGKKQHDTHDYDVFKHSLKVLQKISQNPEFEKLNDSDKKVMMLASLLHDISKAEKYTDSTHAEQGSFDSYFISKKFKLTKEEEIKLYTINRHHEWLNKVNSSKSEEELKKNMQSVAYDLQQDNILDLALMFTHADLKAVKKDDYFHDTTDGKKQIDFNGNVRSFGESADLYAKKMKEMINELKKSQPILPTTKLPSASKIDEKITTVNSDGSTNIKGVYKNKDGLVIIKFSEVENWESLGLPKGCKSEGIFVPKGTKGDDELTEDVNTGNIKFIVHGLDYENQLINFDAFSLLNSDALLSVSYTERPESKYRFFRPQGIILDVDTKYIHGGGNSDAGSGCGKDIDEFKTNYIFGGERESDRLYISNLIKKTTGMTDEEYIDFVEKNKNKQMHEIEPPEVREIMIKTFATINSNTRKGNRSYNEMYISNPNKVNAVFAYNTNDNEYIKNPVDFLNRTTIAPDEYCFGGEAEKSVYERTKFLQEYALKNDLPFIVFGD